MPTRVPFTDLTPAVRYIVDELSARYKVAVVAIDVNPNLVNGGYVALVHHRVVHDPFGCDARDDMPFTIDLADQKRVLAAYRTSLPRTAPVVRPHLVLVA